MSQKEVSIKLDDLDEKAQQRIKEALQQAGIKMKQASATPISVPAQVGTIETTIELDTSGASEQDIARLRDTGFSNEKHAAVLETVLKGASADYVVTARQPFVEWLWCQWQQFRIRELFTKRYEIRPADTTSAASSTTTPESGW